MSMSAARRSAAASAHRRAVASVDGSFTEDWTGSNGASWPAGWTLVDGSGTIQTNSGTQTTPATTWGIAYHRHAGVKDGDLIVHAYLFNTQAERRYITLRFDNADQNSGNGNIVVFDTSNSQINIGKHVGGVWTQVANGPWTPSANWFRIHVNWQGSTIGANIWIDGQAEPTGWMAQGTDTTYQGIVGNVGLETQNGGSVATAITSQWDQFALTDLSGPATAPAAPTGVNASGGNTTALVSWTNSSDGRSAITGSVISEATPSAGAHTASVTGTGVSGTVSGLTNGTAYTFTVVSTNAIGSSAASSPSNSVTPTASLQPVGVGGTWSNLVFDDEFSGASVDTTKWDRSQGGSNNGVTFVNTNSTVSGGNAVLVLSDSTHGAQMYTKAEGGAENDCLIVGGYAEFRAKFPGDGTSAYYNWSAVWTSGPNWPAAGENDVAEMLTSALTVNYHSPSGAHNQGAPPGYWGNAFHVYGIHRMASSCDVYWDGVKVKSYSTDDNGVGECLMLTCGAGSHIGASGALLVDYVRCWTP